MTQITLTEPVGAYPAGMVLEVLGPGEEPRPGAVDAVKARDLVERQGRAVTDAPPPIIGAPTKRRKR